MAGATARSHHGQGVVEGVAIGRAILWAGDPRPRSRHGSAEEERARLSRAIAHATEGVRELARLLPPAEAELFEPEVAILDDIGPEMLDRVAGGERAEVVVNALTSAQTTDLLDDARARLLDGLAHEERSVESALVGREGDLVLVTERLTPSVVASLPAHVVGIVAAAQNPDPSVECTTHAAILARSRDVPLALFRPRVVRSVRDGDELILDTIARPAALLVSPRPRALAGARARRDARAHARSEDEAGVAAPLAHLGVSVHINVGSIHERVPGAVEGIGLVRTELVFSDRINEPSEAEQFGALLALAARVGKVPVTARLFDAGGDKPLEWLPVPAGSDARGTALLLQHPRVLSAQLRAIGRAARHAHVRALLPLVNHADEVQAVRALTPTPLPIGAMIETPQAVDRIDSIAAASDFISVGTNDLCALVTGQPRTNSTLSLDRSVLRMVERVVAAAHRRGLDVSVCGEMAGDPHGARLLVGLGVDTLSVATGRLANVKVSLRDVTGDDCRRVARETLREE